jgi:hypothetical protein
VKRGAGHGAGFFLSGLLAILCPPLFLWVLCTMLWEDRQTSKRRRARIAKCAGNHRIERDPTWDIYPDLRQHEYYCRDCGEPGTSDQVAECS